MPQNRRDALKGISGLLGLAMAPAFVRAESLMPVYKEKTFRLALDGVTDDSLKLELWLNGSDRIVGPDGKPIDRIYGKNILLRDSLTIHNGSKCRTINYCSVDFIMPENNKKAIVIKDLAKFNISLNDSHFESKHKLDYFIVVEKCSEKTSIGKITNNRFII